MLTDRLDFRVYIPDAEGNIVSEREKRICSSVMRYELVSPRIKWVPCHHTTSRIVEGGWGSSQETK